MIVLTRLPLKNFDATQRYTLSNGVLAERKIVRIPADNVVSLQELDGR